MREQRGTMTSIYLKYMGMQAEPRQGGPQYMYTAASLPLQQVTSLLASTPQLIS